jgi:hypothetical protein
MRTEPKRVEQFEVALTDALVSCKFQYLVMTSLDNSGRITVAIAITRFPGNFCM